MAATSQQEAGPENRELFPSIKILDSRHQEAVLTVRCEINVNVSGVKMCLPRTATANKSFNIRDHLVAEKLMNNT
jgi:hypothetical protein